MAGLVEEIQAKVLDNTVATTELLRMVKLAAVKLQLNDAIEWVDHELKGYPNQASVPPYRRSMGEVKAHNPYHGPQPVGGDPGMLDKIARQIVQEPITKIEALIGDGSGTLLQKLPTELINTINKANRMPHMDYYVHIPVAFFIDIQQQVRNLILDWATELEKLGILGEGISFSMEEKKLAAEAAPSITINGNVGSFHSGDVNGHQNRTTVASTDNSTNSLEISDTFDQLIQAVDSNIGNENDRETILELVRAMQAAQGTPEYKPLFQQWVGYLADYATVLGPFLPALSNLAG